MRVMGNVLWAELMIQNTRNNQDTRNKIQTIINNQMGKISKQKKIRIIEN